jgi:hypothetical protein
VSGIVYCKECKKLVLEQLGEAGYLQPNWIGHTGDRRPTEAKEDTRETKLGKDR